MATTNSMKAATEKLKDKIDIRQRLNASLAKLGAGAIEQKNERAA